MTRLKPPKASGPGAFDMLVGGLLVGAGVLLGAAAAGAFDLSPPPPPPRRPVTSALTGMGWRPARYPGVLHPYPRPDHDALDADRARRIRVLVYRIRCGEITLASPEVDVDVCGAVADQIDGYRPPMPSAAADGALPLDWQ